MKREDRKRTFRVEPEELGPLLGALRRLGPADFLVFTDREPWEVMPLNLHDVSRVQALEDALVTLAHEHPNERATQQAIADQMHATVRTVRRLNDLYRPERAS